MSIGPLLPGRIPNGMIGSRLNSNIQDQTRIMAQLQEQLSSGVRFQIPSESPAAAVRALSLQKTLEQQEQNQVNVNTNQSMLAASDSGLSSISEALNQAKSLIISGVGDTAFPSERQALALEAGSLLKQVMNSGNSSFRGRYLFAGSQTDDAPFEVQGLFVRYGGDEGVINSYADQSLLLANNIHGHAAMNALTEPVGIDGNPALTLETKLSDLVSGKGLKLGEVTVTLDNTPQTATVDLSTAKTVQDVKALLENAFAGQPTTLTVSINGTNDGLDLTPSAGNVEVTEVTGGLSAANLGIASGPVAQIVGGDLDPAVTLSTNLADFNGGAGIGPTVGNGLLISNGFKNEVVDISSAVNVEDLFNLLEQADLDLNLGLNDSGNGLAISSRLSGAGFSIGENGGQNATNLGIRTTLTSSLLEDFDFGEGVPVDDGVPLVIERRDGTTTKIDLAGSKTLQDVIDAINAEPDLTATFNTVGNGISIDDTSVGPNPLQIDSTPLSDALGIAGTEVTGPGTPLVGVDSNQREVRGSMTLFIRLQSALTNGDDAELARLDKMLNEELTRINLVRGELGGRQKVLDEVDNRLADQAIQLRETLSQEYEVDIAEVITQISEMQFRIEAAYQVSVMTLQLNLFSFL